MINKDKIKKVIPTDIALWSLCVAVMALSLNAFLSQKAESNLNIRQAAFELIMQLGELQDITHQVHFNAADVNTSRIEGWGNIALINDLSMLLPEPLPTKSAQLKQVWESHYDTLHNSVQSEEAISHAIKETRAELQELLQSL